MRKILTLTVLIALIILIQLALRPPEAPSPERPIHIYSNDLQRLYERAIGSAKHSIWLEIYGLSDPRILQALNHKAAAGLSVTVAYDAKASSGVHRKLHPRIRAEAGRGPGLLHRKLLVIDDEELWIGSSNLSTESLRIHGNIVAAIRCKQLAQALRCAQASGSITLEGQQLSWHSLPEGAEQGLERLVRQIDHARSSLRIAMFTWTHPVLTKAVLRAHARGVQVEVVLDYCSSRGASQQTLDELLDHGVRVLTSERAGLLHHKMAWIDESTLILGSANWTRAAFSKNADVLLCIEGLDRSAKQRLKRCWQQISAEARLARHLAA